MKMKNRDTNQQAAENNKPWSGHIYENEAIRPGGLLMGALLACASERGQTINEMARNVDVTSGYINQLRNGLRNVSSISDKFSEDCANYLGIPRMQVLMLAGQISPSDFFRPKSGYADDVARALNFICEDSRWGHLITGELRNSKPDTQYAVIKLYEAATGIALVQGQTCIQDVLEDLTRAAQEVAKAVPSSALGKIWDCAPSRGNQTGRQVLPSGNLSA